MVECLFQTLERVSETIPRVEGKKGRVFPKGIAMCKNRKGCERYALVPFRGEGGTEKIPPQVEVGTSKGLHKVVEGGQTPTGDG